MSILRRRFGLAKSVRHSGQEPNRGQKGVRGRGQKGVRSQGQKGAERGQEPNRQLSDVPSGRPVRSDLLVLCHGGPIADPDDAQYILDRVPSVDGFYGASSMERLPTEIAIAQQVREFMGLKRQQTP